MSCRVRLFTVIPILVLLAVVANHIAASSIRKPTPALLHLLDDASRVAASAAQRGAVVRSEALPALRHRAERRRLFQVEQLLEARILQRLTNTDAGEVAAVEACSNRN